MKRLAASHGNNIMKISAQHVCEELNKMMNSNDDFKSSLQSRIVVSESIAINTDVCCSVIEGGFDTSALGFINALTDEPICLFISSKDEPDVFCTVAFAKETCDAEWDEYIKALNAYNKEHETNHQPEKRIR